MDLENFKKKVEENLKQRVGTKEAERLMKSYEDYFPMFLEKNLSVVATATAMILGY